MANIVSITTPCNNEVKRYLELWDTMDNYVLQESALYKLFNVTYPKNTDIDDILIKASSLNDFYSTNIYSIFDIAKHILDLDIDDRLMSGDLSLVNDMKKVEIRGKTRNFYSFSTKYCSHHQKEKFPIYDSLVDKVLCYFKKADNFSDFKKYDLKDYVTFNDVLGDFVRHYSLDYGLKDIDRYLWLLGKEHYQVIYNK